MTTGWTLTRLGDVIRIKHGLAFSGMAENSDTTLPVVVGIGNFDYAGGFRFGSTTVKRLQGDYPTEYELVPGDVLLAMTCQTAGGEILGIPGTIPVDGQTYLHNQRLGKVEVLDPERISLPFIFQLARWKMFNQYLFATASGSKILHTSPGRIEDFEVDLPPVVEQRAIAATLGALDDKVALNRRVAVTILDLIDAVFNQTSRQLMTSNTYGDVAEISGGGTPSTKQPDYWDGDINWATPTDITGLGAPFLDRTARQITDAGLAHCSSALHPAGSILMTSRATIGAFALAMTPTATNQGFIVVQALNPVHQLWLFHEMRTRVNDYVAHANGATFLELSRGKFKDLPVAWPVEEGTFLAFNARVKPLHDRAYAAMKESRTLAALRDTLLPALMSGRLSVRDAEAAVSEVV